MAPPPHSSDQTEQVPHRMGKGSHTSVKAHRPPPASSPVGYEAEVVGKASDRVQLASQADAQKGMGREQGASECRMLTEERAPNREGRRMDGQHAKAGED